VDSSGEEVGTGLELGTLLEEMEHHKRPGFVGQLYLRTVGLVRQYGNTADEVHEDLRYTKGWKGLAKG
jgi:hypothetical protein